MCKYFIEIVKAANFGQNPYKLSFAIQYRETSHSLMYLSMLKVQIQ